MQCRRQQQLLKHTVRPLAEHGRPKRRGMGLIGNTMQDAHEVLVAKRPPVRWVAELDRLKNQVLEEEELKIMKEQKKEYEEIRNAELIEA